MTPPAPLVEIWRGDLLESLHSGHAVIVGADGEVEAAWGDPDALIYPRSSCKMMQALPLVESGAALTSEQLALACASHEGAAIHTDRVQAWLGELGLSDADLRCGSQRPRDPEALTSLIKTDASPCQYHNNCSGKHAGFLHLTQHLGAGPEYNELDHPLQIAIRAAFEEVTEETSPTYAIDGCSAPNFATPLSALARGAARFATAGARADGRSKAMVRLVEGMMAHPDLVAGTGRACTALMQACDGRAAVKTGAEGVFVAILPGLGKAVALKITDGSMRAADCAIAALLVRLGVADAKHPGVAAYVDAPIVNRRGIVTGRQSPAEGLRT